MMCVVWYSSAYFEYKFMCALSGDRIVIWLQWSGTYCVEYLSWQYAHYTRIQQDLWVLTWSASYVDYATSRLQAQMTAITTSSQNVLAAMRWFENTLFEKTILYLRNDLTPRIDRYTDYRAYRQKAMQNALKIWSTSDYLRIQARRNNEQLKLVLMKAILNSKDFDDMMPLFTIYSTLWE